MTSFFSLLCRQYSNILAILRKRPHKGGAAPKSGAAVAARLLGRNRPTEAVSARPSGRNRAGTGQEPGRNRAGTGRRAETGQEPGRSRAATARPHHSDTEPENARICRHFNIFARFLQR